MAMFETLVLTMLTPMFFVIAYVILIRHGRARGAGAEEVGSHAFRHDMAMLETRVLTMPTPMVFVVANRI